MFNELSVYYILLFFSFNCKMFYYENKTRDRTLEEIMKFKLRGLKIRGYDGNEINIRVGPGQTKFIELEATSSNWRIQTSLSYGII